MMTSLPARISRRRGGFTLLELLIVMAIMATLMGLLLAAIFRVNTGIRNRRADAAAQAIQSAIQAYHHRYHQWPAPRAHLQAGEDIVYGQGNRPNREVVSRLFHPPDGNAPADGRLPADALLDPKHFRVEDRNLLDPWWNNRDDAQYRIQMDMNYDGNPPGGVRVWSVNR